MPAVFSEPKTKRAIVFFDGQNLYHCARETFGCSHPNYDVLALAKAVCKRGAYALAQVRFYTGFPDARDDVRWNKFWSRKLLAITRQGVWTFSRQLRYRNRQITIGDGAVVTQRIGEEKGIDVRLAIDLIRLAHQKRYDVAIVFSQDQDLSEVAKEIRIISKEQARWIKGHGHEDRDRRDQGIRHCAGRQEQSGR